MEFIYNHFEENLFVPHECVILFLVVYSTPLQPLFLKDFFKLGMFTERSRETDRRIFHPLVLSQWLQYLELKWSEARSLLHDSMTTGAQGLGHPSLLPQHITREPDGKWSSRDRNQHPYRMPVLEGRGLSCLVMTSASLPPFTASTYRSKKDSQGDSYTTNGHLLQIEPQQCHSCLKLSD